MAKEKTPFFSMGARGTVGGAITAQKLGASTLLRKKPIPAYRYTLAQAYHRWDYQDAIAQWNDFTYDQKRAYAIAGSRKHMTALAVWIQEYLLGLSDIEYRYRLDTPIGAHALDSSKNARHATVFGASEADGLIDGAYHFDGINDYLDCGGDLIPNTDFSIEGFLKTAVNQPLISSYNVVPGYWHVRTTAGNLRFYGRDTLAPGDGAWRSLVAVTDDELHHFAVNIDIADDVYIFIDGVEGTAPVAGNITRVDGILHQNLPMYIGAHPGVAQWYAGDLDNLVIRNRLLSQADIDRYRERRYPAV